MSAPPPVEPARPNILFLLTDNQRDDLMGCAGNPVIQTPNMDRLAAGGARFTNAFVTTPICAASRASFFCEERFEHPGTPKSFGVRTERWKYIRYFEQQPVYEELYDLASDPHERVNLAGRDEHRAVLDDLRKESCEWEDRLAQSPPD